VTEDAVRFGVLGAARIAPKALIQPATELGKAKVVAIAARDAVRALKFAADHRIPRVVPSYQDLIETPDIEAVYLPLPNSLHAYWAICALRAGKHVLCEKPIASNAVEARQMAQAADESGRILAEAFHYRYHPLAARIRDFLRSGCIGRLRELAAHFAAPGIPTDIRFNYSLSGGAMMDLGCYTLDMVRYFSGQTPVVRQARARIGPPQVDVEMTAELELRDGAKAYISCSMAPETQAGAWFRAAGDDGELFVTNPVAPHIGHSIRLRTGRGERCQVVEGKATYFYQLEAFVAAVRARRPLATPLNDSIVNMQLIDDVYRAAGLATRGGSGSGPSH
jgi:predicted dehydrogenase